VSTFVKKHWPLIAALLIYWATLAVLTALSLKRNQGHFVYTLDDPYIHMAMAKNIALHKVWGVTKYAFTSSSSSPFWTLLLSLAYRLFGVNELTPFIFTTASGTLLVLVIYLILKNYSPNGIFVFVVLLLAIFITPLPALTFCGMEHILHGFLTVVFVYLFSKTFLNKSPAMKEYLPVLLLAPLICSVRFEGAFLILAASILLAFRKNFLFSAFLGIMGILPILAYGLFSLSNGWHFLPNTILLKTFIAFLHTPQGIETTVLYSPLLNMWQFPYIMLLLIISLLLLVHGSETKIPDDLKVMNIIFIAVTLLNLQFIIFVWFYRYEAYLVTTGIVVVAVTIGRHLPQKFSWEIRRNLLSKYIAAAILIFIISLPFITRAKEALTKTSWATTNIYQQQYQMGLFLNKFYRGRAVAANDVGAIDYLADIKTLDLFGLTSLEIANIKINGNRNPKASQMYDIAKRNNVEIAIVYDSWFEGDIPSQWVKVGLWKIAHNLVCASDTISFYAVEPSEQKQLLKNLIAFAPQLPRDVSQYICINAETK
jgi:hypothetical protein